MVKNAIIEENVIVILVLIKILKATESVATRATNAISAIRVTVSFAKNSNPIVVFFVISGGTLGSMRPCMTLVGAAAVPWW